MILWMRTHLAAILRSPALLQLALTQLRIDQAPPPPVQEQEIEVSTEIVYRCVKHRTIAVEFSRGWKKNKSSKQLVENRRKVGDA